MRRESKELVVDAFLESKDLFDDANRLLNLPMPVDEFAVPDELTKETEEEEEVQAGEEEKPAKRQKLEPARPVNIGIPSTKHQKLESARPVHMPPFYSAATIKAGRRSTIKQPAVEASLQSQPV